MTRLFLGGVLLSGLFCPVAIAQALCPDLAERVRASLLATPDDDRDPSQALAALAEPQLRIMRADPGHWGTGPAQAAKLPPESASLARSVEALGNNVNLIELPAARIWIFVQSAGTLACHRLVAARFLPGGATRAINLPMGQSEADLCGAEVMAMEVGDQAALITEETLRDDDHAETNLTITPLTPAATAPSCGVAVHYRLRLRAEHGFCHTGVDCGAILRVAEHRAMVAQAGGSAPTQADEVDQATADQLRAGYDRMRQAAGQSHEIDIVPSFIPFQPVTGADQFGRDAELFAFRLGDGQPLLSRLGHGHRGANASIGYIFTAYQRTGDAMVPVAGISIEPFRAGITMIERK